MKGREIQLSHAIAIERGVRVVAAICLVDARTVRRAFVCGIRPRSRATALALLDAAVRAKRVLSSPEGVELDEVIALRRREWMPERKEA